MSSKAVWFLRAAITRTALLATCWWAITEGAWAATGIGALAVAGGVVLSLRMHEPQAFSFWGLARFIPVFLWRSLAGGVDVARRALAPAMPLEPSLIEYRTQLPAGLPRVVLANVVSLLPGTLSADLDDNVLLLHVLSESAGDETGLRRLEVTVARIFA